jgi:hypothetical protein
MNDPTTSNNGVWQLIPGAAAWSYFSSDLDFVDELELATALNAKVDKNQGTSNAGKTLVVGSDGLVAPGPKLNPLPVANGGTGAVTAAAALAALGAAPLASPALSGTPTAPTAAAGTSTSQLATTEFVKKAVGDGSGISQFTFIVDSISKMVYWALNATGPGCDYTSVLIAPGEWSSSVSVNLTATKTKVVVGMPGSSLRFTSGYCLYYDERPTLFDYRMEGVTINRSSSGGSYAFYNCANLINCSCSTSSTDSIGYGFYKCDGLINCGATGSGYGSNNGFGFNDCTNLTNCYGHGVGNGTGAGVGFYNCKNLVNCTGTGRDRSGGSGVKTGFYECSNLSNCDGTGYGADYNGFGFMYCDKLTSCTGTGNANGPSGGANSGSGGTGHGFYYCTNLTHCVGAGGNTGSDFYRCNGMVLNKTTEAGNVHGFNTCFVSLSGSGTITSNSAAGGWNLGTGVLGG